MSGYFVVQRSVFEHVDFADEPFTEREAWLWLISEAAWQPKRVRVGGGSVMLERGELAHSLRFLAGKWKWSIKRVRGFIDRSEKSGRLTKKRAHDGAVLTICNYDKYQLQGHTEGQSEGTARAQQGHKEEELKNTSSNPQRVGLIHPDAGKIALELEKVLGIDRSFVPPQWCGAEMRISACLDQGWLPEVILSSVRRQASSRGQSPPVNFKFYEKGIAEDHAKTSAPVPQARIIPAETVEVRRAAKTQSQSPQDAIRNILGRVREGGIRARADDADVREFPPRGGE